MDIPVLLKQMSLTPASVPPLHDLQAVFAIRLAKVANKLTPSELADFIQLGADIGDRLTQAVVVASRLI